MSDAHIIASSLRKQAEQISEAGHAGWGNLDRDAADLIEQQAARIIDLEKEKDELLMALAACRDAFPIPDRGVPLEGYWAGAMADPREVPFYVKACLESAQPTKD